MATQWLFMFYVDGGGGTPNKHGALKVVFQLLFSGELTYTVVPCAHTVVVCVVVGGGPVINRWPLKLLSSGF